MLLAGFETSSSTIANTCYLLSHPTNQAAQARLRSEIDASESDATSEQVLALPFLDAAIKEALRILPPAHVTAREAPKEMIVGGTSLLSDDVQRH